MKALKLKACLLAGALLCGIAGTAPALADSSSTFSSGSISLQIFNWSTFRGANLIVSPTSFGTYGADGSYTAGQAITGNVNGVNEVAVFNFAPQTLISGTFTSDNFGVTSSSFPNNPVNVSVLGVSPTNYAQATGGTTAFSFNTCCSSYGSLQSNLTPANFATGFSVAVTSGTIGLGAALASAGSSVGAGASGMGTPGPVAGAGLPFLAVAGALAWMARRKAVAA